MAAFPPPPPPPPPPSVAYPTVEQKCEINFKGISKCERLQTVSETESNDGEIESSLKTDESSVFLELHKTFKDCPVTVPNLADAIKARKINLCSQSKSRDTMSLTHSISSTYATKPPQTNADVKSLPPPPPPPLAPPSIQSSTSQRSTEQPNNAATLPMPPPIPIGSIKSRPEECSSNDVDHVIQSVETFSLKSSDVNKIVPPQCAPPPPPPSICSMTIDTDPLLTSGRELQNLTISANVPGIKVLWSPKRTEGRCDFDSRFKFVDDSSFPDPTCVLKYTDKAA